MNSARKAGLPCVMAWLLAGIILQAHAAEFWVSPSGKDENVGSKEAPVATLARAQVLERQSRAKDPKSPVTVWLAPGNYLVDSGWTLGVEDSGSADAPVVWRAVEPGKARLIGCRSVPPEAWKPIADADLVERLAPEAKGHVLQLDLASAGFQPAKALSDYNKEAMWGFALFAADEKLPISRWPNGYYGYTTMQSVLNNGVGQPGTSPGGTFVYREDEPARWLKAVDESGLWVKGFWRVPWVAETMRVQSIDTTNKSITLSSAVPSGIGSKYAKVVNNIRVGDGKENWCALNLLEEIDLPGEWAVDFKRNRIYLWPPTDAKIAISENNFPLVTFSSASYVEFRGLTLGWNLGDGVRIDAGDHIKLVGCDMHQIGRQAVTITGGTGHSILGNDIYDVGLSAIEVAGGDRATLTPCGDEICNNYICRVSLDAPIPAIVAGLDAHHQNVVGIHVANNRINGASAGGITFAGNDNVFEYNEIYRVGLDSGDLGAFYTTGGWTSRGNIVRYNFIHHSENANGVYMDDGDSGLQVYGNLFYKINSALFIGGGHDNIVRNNLVVACERAIHVDDRGVSRNYAVDDHRLRGDFDSVPTQTPPWSEKYPALVDFLKKDPRIPSGDVLEKNIAVACAALARQSGSPANLAGYALKDNVEIPDIGIFVDAEVLNFHLKDPNGLDQALPGFEPVPLDKMGLQVDANRLAIPARDLEQLKSESTRRKTFDSQQDVDSSRKAP